MKPIVMGYMLALASFFSLNALETAEPKPQEIEYPAALPEDLAKAERLKTDAQAREREFSDQLKKNPDDERIKSRLEVAQSDTKTADLMVQLYNAIKEGKSEQELQPLQQALVDNDKERTVLIGELQKTYVPAGGQVLTDDQQLEVAQKIGNLNLNNLQQGVIPLRTELTAMERGQNSTLIADLSYTTDQGLPNYNAQLPILKEMKDQIEKIPAQSRSKALSVVLETVNDRINEIDTKRFSIPSDNAVAQDLLLGEQIPQDRARSLRNFLDDWPTIRDRYATPQEKLNALNQVSQADLYYGNPVLKDGTRGFDLWVQYRNEARAELATIQGEKRAELESVLESINKTTAYQDAQQRQNLIKALTEFSQIPALQPFPDFKASVDERVKQLINFVDQPRPDISPELVPTLKLNELKLDEKIPQDQLATIKTNFSNNLDAIIKSKNTEQLKDYLELLDMYKLKDADSGFVDTLQSAINELTPVPEPAVEEYDPNFLNNPAAALDVIAEVAQTVGQTKESLNQAASKGIETVSKLAGATKDAALTMVADNMNTAGEFLQAKGEKLEKIADLAQSKKIKFLTKVIDALYKISPDLGRSVISGTGQLLKDIDFVFKTNLNQKLSPILEKVGYLKQPTVVGYEIPLTVPLNPTAKVVGEGVQMASGLMSYLGQRANDLAATIRPSITTSDQALDTLDTLETVSLLVDRNRNNPHFKDPTYYQKAKTVFDTAITGIKDHVTELFSKDSPIGLDKAKNDYVQARTTLLRNLNLSEDASPQAIQAAIEKFVPSSRKDLLQDYLQATSNLQTAYQKALEEMEGDFAGFQFLIDGWDTVSTGPAAQTAPIAALTKFGFDMVEQRAAYLNAAKDAVAGLGQEVDTLTNADPTGKLFQNTLSSFVNKAYVDTVSNFYTGAQQLSTNMKNYKDQAQKTISTLIQQ